MKIIAYREEDETLLVQYNTKWVWDYRPITKEMYRSLMIKKDQSKTLTSMIRSNFIIGTIKEVNNDFKR